MAATHGLLGPLLEAAEAGVRLSHPRVPSQGPLESLVNTLLFAGHTQNIPTLRTLHKVMGKRMRVFGGETLTSFVDVRELMARESEKIEWLSGPIDDRADYLTKGYMPFLVEGPNHEMRREHILRGIARAYTKLRELDALLDEGPDADHAITRFLFRHFCAVELEESEVEWFLEFKQRAQPMVLLPKLLRQTLLRATHEELQERRLYFLKRIEDAGQPIADSWFDAIWFNAGTLGFYPEKALQAIRQDPELRLTIQDEISLPIDQRTKTRALVHEVLRIYGKIASTNYVEEGRVRIALMATAVVDSARYHEPSKIDLTRDHSDTLSFSGPAPNRKCPAEHFAPDLMASVVVHGVREAMARAPTN